MAILTKNNWSKEKLKYDGIFIIGEFIFENHGTWFGLKEGGSQKTQEAIGKIMTLGDSWKKKVFELYGSKVLESNERDFTFSPSFHNMDDNTEFINYLMRSSYSVITSPIREEEEEEEKLELEEDSSYNVWNKMNFDCCDELRVNDVINFTDDDEYTVKNGFLQKINGGSNNSILYKAFGSAYPVDLDALYGYPSSTGDWPECNHDDFAALTRVMIYIFKCMYHGGGKPNMKTDDSIIKKTDDSIIKKTDELNINDDPKLTNSKVKISNITVLDDIKLL